MPTERVPRHSHHTKNSREHTAEHSTNTLWSPPENLGEGTFGKTGEVEDIDGVADSIALVGKTESGALVEANLGDAATGLGLKRSLNEGDGETGLQMPFNVT